MVQINNYAMKCVFSCTYQQRHWNRLVRISFHIKFSLKIWFEINYLTKKRQTWIGHRSGMLANDLHFDWNVPRKPDFFIVPRVSQTSSDIFRRVILLFLSIILNKLKLIWNIALTNEALAQDTIYHKIAHFFNDVQMKICKIVTLPRSFRVTSCVINVKLVRKAGHRLQCNI